MSAEKNRKEADRWYKQAKVDLNAAKGSREAENFEWACFQCQQAAEKALKALWFFFEQDPWGHSVLNLINSFPGEVPLSKYVPDAQLLDKLYIPTRYPNGLPDLSPFEVFSVRDADQAIDAAGRIIAAVGEHVENKHKQP